MNSKLTKEKFILALLTSLKLSVLNVYEKYILVSCHPYQPSVRIDNGLKKFVEVL